MIRLADRVPDPTKPLDLFLYYIAPCAIGFIAGLVLPIRFVPLRVVVAVLFGVVTILLYVVYVLTVSCSLTGECL